MKGSVAADALAACGDAGKIVIDATNPIGGPPQNGVLRFFTNLGESLVERLQGQVPNPKFTKALNSVGNARMVNPDFGGVRPTMFICGNDTAAKPTVTRILDQFGWETEIWDPQKRRARLRRCACFGAFQVFCATSGPTRSNC